MNAIRYIFWLILTASTLVLVAALFIFVVDPYGINGRVVIEGFNVKKPEAYTHVWRAKEARAVRATPDTVILGNSRADVGLDPQSPHWPDEAGRAFNFAIPGAGMEGVRRAYDFQVARTAPRHFYIGLDFMDFLSSDRAADPSLPVQADTERRWQTYAMLYLSQIAFIDSVRTVASQSDVDTRTMTPDGFNTLADYDRIIRLEGHFAVADQRDRENLRTYDRRPRHITPGGRETDAIVALRGLVEDAAERGIRLTFFTYPYHADLLVTMEKTGFRALRNDWKRLMTDILAEYRDRYPETVGPFWDFIEYNAFTSETIPQPGDTRSRMAWYWEPGHFKATLGELMIRRMAGDGRVEFGAVLTPDTIDDVLAHKGLAESIHEQGRDQAEERIDDLCGELAVSCVD